MNRQIAHFLIKYRHILAVMMTALCVVSVFLFPRINVVSDMTTYLPDASRMKQGLDLMKESFSQIDVNGVGVNAMFLNEATGDSLSAELSDIEGVATIIGKRTNERYTLFQFLLDPGASGDLVAETISGRYGDSVIVETTSQNLLPDNMNFIIVAGVSILTLILVIMCSSIVEVILFLVAIGIAVVINIGTNAFLPGVSMVTNAIAAILQLILSMDYSIILMNRYRQVKRNIPEKVEAMTCALADATPTILSSSLTTILCMLMLAFMDFKIGLDMGLVLSKGVFLSLVSIYLLLPALVLAFDRAIEKTEKKVPLLHTYKLSKFEVRFRVLISVAFVVFFAASYFLSQRTDICFSNTWPTEISREFPPQNQVVLLYETDREEEVIPVIDSLAKDPRMVMAMSYPSIVLKERTADEMLAFINEMSSMLPEGMGQIDSTMFNADLLNVVYYAASHSQRDEMMSFSDIESFVGNLPKEMVSGFDMESMMQKVMDDIEEPEVTVVPYQETSPVDPTVSEESILIEESAIEDSGLDPGLGTEPKEAFETVVVSQEKEGNTSGSTRFTAENSTKALTSREMAEFLGFERGQASTIYKMAGRSKALMTPQEFVHYVTDKILTRNLYAKMISAGQKKELAEVRHQIDSAVLAGEKLLADVVAQDVAAQDVAVADTVAVEVLPADVAVDSVETVLPVKTEVVPVKVEVKPIVDVPPTPLEVLLDMASSDKKYASDQVGRALRDAGIDVAQSDVDLLFMYYGSSSGGVDSLKMSLAGIMDFVTGPLLTDPMYERFIDESAKEGIMMMKQAMIEGLGSLRGEKYSMATLISDYETESKETFDYISRVDQMCQEALGGETYMIGESVMYKEMSDGFSREMMVVTLLTIVVIFIVVALTFQSMIVPVFLLLIVMSAVYVCVFVGGLGGQSMNYLAYLVTQSILMGATIDYAILFTDYYREKRVGLPIDKSLRKAYKSTIHSIMTSGLILIFCPYIMSILLTDPTISPILRSISVGALSSILLIIFVLPGLLAAFDKLVTGVHSRNG
jgi:predicted RND superfamily exporter protein